MRKFLASALAALTFGGAVAATASPAAAEPYRHGWDHRHHGDGDDVAIAAAAGIAGLAIGAALSGGHNGGGHAYYGNGYRYDPRGDGYYGDYYGRSYYGRPGYRTCTTYDRVWDPYIGRHVTVEHNFPC